MAAVHPRAYGEEMTDNLASASTNGSPPCVRGRGSKLVRQSADGRFTPVRTGKSRPLGFRHSRSPVHPRAYGEEAGYCAPSTTPSVHPRAYGEECVSVATRSAASGSPPCVRGRELLQLAQPTGQRFTPVRTGKSHGTAARLSSLPVHPRAYGEEIPVGLAVGDDAGSPPCVRGRGMQRSPSMSRTRFTPVRTGKSCRFASTSAPPSVHPRAYGEEAGCGCSSCRAGGSPPCVRGRGRGSMESGAGLRFTPVRTGKRNRMPHSPRCRPVHPRAYGEEHNASRRSTSDAGSPPCVRGRVIRVLLQPWLFRFTPVRTGKRQWPATTAGRRAVHPRAYGEETGKLRLFSCFDQPNALEVLKLNRSGAMRQDIKTLLGLGREQKHSPTAV